MWADFAAWLQSPGGSRVLQTAIIPAIAILVAGVLAALIGRAAVGAAIGRADRAEAASAVAGLVEAARAASEPDGDRGQRRRAVRLRTEADVRTRLLPIAGAALAADWVSARTDALQSSEAPVPAELAELRDRLVAWTKSPRRAKRIFGATPTAAPGTPSDEVRGVAADETPTRASAVRSAPSDDAAQPVVPPMDSTPAPAVPASTEATAGAATAPAWQRTRAGERLQQERAVRSQSAESDPISIEQVESVDTAPVVQHHAHRAQVAPVTDADEAVRLEAQVQARRSRAEEATPAPAAPTPSPAPLPAWLDTYDDEAQVTQNFDLKTPPPVAAASVRDRGQSGDDLVPRS